MSADPRCPICGRTAGAAQGNPAFPFCSARCKLIDLGNWLDGRYRVAGPSIDEGSLHEGGAEDDGSQELPS